MNINEGSGPQIRFDRRSWMRAAMEVLAREGQAKLRVEALAKSLGVTKGSFYHHFKNREDFVASLLGFWAEDFTGQVIETISTMDASADERLLELTRMVERLGLDRYDIAFRSWAAQDPKVAAVVDKVDEARYRYIRSLFEEMGFTGDELERRVHIWLVFASAQRAILVPRQPSDAEADLLARHRFFTALP